ncbi:MAG: helix-turn-helix transcriptional regulator [Clostridia bacterium]|nr:helix-turn-helix transcriptional regulator [Clostridia bacterium]
MASRIGELVRREREKRGWSQRRLAEVSGLDNTNVSKIETSNRRRPTATALEKLSGALNIPLAAGVCR